MAEQEAAFGVAMVAVVFFFVPEDHTVPFDDHLDVGLARFGTPERTVAPYDWLGP